MPGSLVESVKQDIKSLASCTPSTVSSLQTLLRPSNPDAEKTASSQKRDTKTTKAGTISKNSRSTRTTKSRTAAKVSVFQAPTDIQDEARLSRQEKLVLATEVFNVASKSLSDALKTPVSRRQLANTPDQLQHTPNTKAPLRASSPNRIVPSPTKSKPSHVRRTSTLMADEGVLATAECARLSLSCLRTLRSEQGDQPSEFPNMQLEQGACILAGRLLSLGLNELAYKELRGLKRRIQQHLDNVADSAGRTKKAGTVNNFSDDASKESMADLLTFKNIGAASSALGLLVSFQANALRLIVSEKRSSVIQKLYPTLILSNPSSPARIITDALKSGALSKDKAALQLQSLSYNLSCLCPSGQKYGDQTPPVSKSQAKPVFSLNIQLLALEVRTMWWKVSGHVCEPNKELWDPLARSLSAFAQNEHTIDDSEFSAIYKTILRLQSAMGEDERKLSVKSKDPNTIRKINVVLGQLAQEAGCTDYALTIYNNLLGLPALEQSVVVGIIRCRIACLNIQMTKSAGCPAAIAQSLSEAAATLGSLLKGTATDMEQLLIESAKLKKLAMSVLANTVSRNGGTDGATDELKSRVVEYLQGFVRFLRRYIGRQPAEDSDEKEFEQFQHKIAVSKNIILAAIDSATAVGKLVVMGEATAWEDALPMFSDCQRILGLLEPENLSQDDSFVDDTRGIAFVKLSNVFWSRYLKERESGKGYKQLIPLLRQSTALLLNCSPSERSTGFAALKFERLAHLYAEGNIGSESAKAFHQSIHEHIGSGILQDLMSTVAGKPAHRAFQDPKSEGFVLGRVLNGHLRVQLRRRNNTDPVTFDDTGLEPEERGFILEWQMGLLMDAHVHSSSDESLRPTLTSLVSTLLSLYTPDVYPIHRLRIIMYTLRFILQHPGAVDVPVAETLVSEGTAIIKEGRSRFDDPVLSGLEGHLKSCLRLTLGFHTGDLAPEELEAVVQSWIQVAQSCHEWESVETRVGDAEYWILQMNALLDYLEIRGMWKLQLSVFEILLHIVQLQTVKDASEIVLLQSRSATQYCRLGNCARAGTLLTQANQHIENNRVSSFATLSNHLVNVEYLLETGSLEKAASALSAARTFCQSSQVKGEISSSSGTQKMSWERVIADAALVHSKFFYAQGSMANALFFAKLSVRLNCRLWAKLEKMSQKKEDTPERDSCDAEVDTVTEGMANLNMKDASSKTYSEGSPFWPHIASHHSSLMNLVHLSAHSGLLQDAIYYAEQAVKINRTLNAKVRLIACQAQLGYDWIRGGHIPEGQELLKDAVEMSQELDNSIEIVSLRVSLAALYQAKGLHDQQSRALSEAERAVLDLCRPDSMMPLDLSSPDLGIEDKMEKLEIQKPSRKPRRAATTATTQRTRKAKTTSSESVSSKASSATAQSVALLKLRGDILRQQASCSLAGHDFDKALSLLKDAWQFAMSRAGQISTQIDESEHLLADTIRRFSTHAVYCVLPESTLSLPSVQSTAKEIEDLASTEASSTTKKTPAVRKTRATSTRGTRSRTTKKEEDFSTMLSRASNPLGDIFKAAITCGSTADAHAASRLMSRMSLLSNATASGALGTDLASPANVTEIGRIGAFERAQLSIEIDKQLPSFSDPLSWPVAPTWTRQLQSYSCSDFTSQYIDILPDNWNVISLSLSADRTDIVISKMHKGRAPFLLRLPLKRGDSEDEEEEEEFTFDEGKRELQDIIKLANISAHDARSRTDRQSRKEWWANREALDRRLETLLCNVENIWLGGFRGVFSPASRNVDLLSRFGDAFQNVLDKHLPSRRKGGKAGETRLTLHSSVLELFTGIQNLESREDPEDLLMDLLYFVVDILQFHGERNAYDEIDFDMMVVDTLDALRSYHESVQNEGHSEPDHTILILDKALHSFPWESLPCLQGLPVSRMPSLQCIRDRIMDFQQHTNDISQGLHINRSSGTYILNPGGDLKATQGTFEEDLSSIKGWTSIVNREPSEPEFKEALESRSLLLYFGHGSGAQYIRGRTIKRLDRCAVTFLMGCSSGCLTEAGDYEPYGTPMNYMHAGTPALVATLWDVTDKDIDRFAKSTFDMWGLLAGSEAVQGDVKGKSRCVKGAVTSQDSMSDRPVALDEAVTKSRTSCLLRYLNGAAPVIYGVPVFLK
ncbi:separin protein [Paecilomyces lecythidis]|uniref:separase n=1 Tax=Paecilomyces lecythidis TaxID=3004212 RepID=A0ABR3Y914_9EURO